MSERIGRDELKRIRAASPLLPSPGDVEMSHLAMKYEELLDEVERAESELESIRDVVRGAFGPGTHSDMVIVIEQSLDEYYGDEI